MGDTYSPPSNMVRIPFFFLLLASSLQGQNDRLPEYMLGQFALETSEGMNALMKEMGVGWFKRIAVCALTPYITHSQADTGEVTIHVSTTFKEREEKFMLGVPYKLAMPIITSVPLANAVVRLEGNKLTKEMTGVDKGEKITIIEGLNFSYGGDRMKI